MKGGPGKGLRALPKLMHELLVKALFVRTPNADGLKKRYLLLRSISASSSWTGFRPNKERRSSTIR